MDFDVSCESADGLLTLLALRGIGPRRAERIAARFATLGDVREAAPEELKAVVPGEGCGGLGDECAWERAFSSAARVLEEARTHTVRVLAASDPAYPTWLRRIRDRPPVVYVKGELLTGRRYVACIGTREPSRFGIVVTQRITSYLVEHGWGIVSGLATGIDTVAHRCTLEARGHTVAVLANGLEAVYPKANEHLADEILANGGALLSEQPFGVPAVPRNLISRDRLQSGMSAGTIVMQTDIVGGSMHTARFTLLQRRKLFAPVPRGMHAEDAKSQGILALTGKSGARLSGLLAARGEYRDILEGEYRDRPPAVPIKSRADYGLILEQLKGMLREQDPGAAKEYKLVGETVL